MTQHNDRVVIESPFAGDIAANVHYLGRAVHDCIDRNEAPIASHGLFPQFYNDSIPAEREACMRAGWAWMEVADAVVVYTDYGISPGMQRGIDHARSLGKLVLYRQIGLNVPAHD